MSPAQVPVVTDRVSPSMAEPDSTGAISIDGPAASEATTTAVGRIRVAPSQTSPSPVTVIRVVSVLPAQSSGRVTVQGPPGAVASAVR